MYISLTVAIFSQCIHISKCPVVHLKYIQFLYVKDISIKLFLKNKLKEFPGGSVVKTLHFYCRGPKFNP